MTNVDIQQVLERPLVVTSHARGHGPRVALRTWLSGRRSVAETAEWLEDARLEAILGSCRRSLPSVRCVGVTCHGGHVCRFPMCSGQA